MAAETLSESAAVHGEALVADPKAVRELMEYYATRGWTDGLPVVPTTESYLAEFLATTRRDPEDVLFTVPHLNRSITVRLLALNAALAGCLPEYFPVVQAAWEAIAQEPHPRKGIWQSTTGTAPMTVVNGPIRRELGINCEGNIFGSGFRANATIGRAIRLGLINVFGLHPHQLDQATQGTPAKYTLCIGEDEESSPWAPLHTEYGFDASQNVVTALVIRNVMHIEARQTSLPEQLGRDLAGTVSRTGALIHEYTNALLVLAPEHARLFADAGWSKDDVRRFVFENATLSRDQLAAVGKDALSRLSRWRLPGQHPDAIPDEASESAEPDTVHAVKHPNLIQVMVAGADNAGVSAVVDVFGLVPRERPMSFSLIE